MSVEATWGFSETVKHHGQTYEFTDDDSTAEVTYLDDGRMPDHCRTIYYLLELKGAHKGEPIRVKMVNPNVEYDDGGCAYVWDYLLWADNDGRIDDVVEEWYSEALHEELKQIVNETWD